MFRYMVKYYGIILASVGMGLFFLPAVKLLMDGAFAGKDTATDMNLTFVSMVGFFVLIIGTLVFRVYVNMGQKQAATLTVL